MRLRLRVLIIFCVLCTAGCTSNHAAYSWKKAMQEKLAEFSAYSRQELQDAFNREHIIYPPKQITLLVFKQSRHLELYASQQGQWRYIKSFPIKAASGGPGPKLKEGDHQVPEGVYHIVSLNPLSHYDLSMRLDYPNRFDRVVAQHNHRYHLGGDIYIHGKSSSVGCIAIGNSGIEQLFPLVAAVGIDHVKVIIAPNDFRYKKPIYQVLHPKWLPNLYRKIKLALGHFPLRRLLH